MKRYLFLIAMIMGPSLVFGAGLYQFSGKVKGVSPDRITVDRDGVVRSFVRDSRLTSKPAQPRVGEDVTIWLRLESVQQPGEAAPAPKDPAPEFGRPPQFVPGTLDDRSFYNAGVLAPSGPES